MNLPGKSRPAMRRERHDLHFRWSCSQTHPGHRRWIGIDGCRADGARVDQQCIAHPLHVYPMRVTEDDHVRTRIEPGQAMGESAVEALLARQLRPLPKHVKSLEHDAKEAGLVSVCQHDPPSGKAQIHHSRQRCPTVGEIENVDVTPHSMHRRDCTQRVQRLRTVHVASVEDQVHASQCIKHGIGQDSQAMRNMGIGEQTDNKGGHLTAVYHR